MAAQHLSDGRPDGFVLGGTYSSTADTETLTYNGNKLINMACTCASTNASTSFEPVLFTTTMTGAGQVGGRAKFDLTINAAAGGWSNALKGIVTYGTSGSTTGLGSTVCVEMSLSAGCTSGTYAPLEIELVMPTGAVNGTCTSFMHLQASGAAVTTFDTNGYLFTVTGLTSGSGSLWYDHQGTAPANTEEWLRIKTPAGVRYLAVYNAVV